VLKKNRFMCGINGAYKFSGDGYSEKLMAQMNESLKQRGPDAEGIYRDDFVALGHKRLAIIDPEEKSNQPFKSKDGRYVMVFNGEIYNYESIKANLTEYSFETEGDTEVVLAAYIKYGENCLRLFNGMFAFALWDNIDKQLFIARDRLGIKPLYYFLNDDEIIFSSSIKAILNTDLIERKIAFEGLVDYLRYQTVHAPYTIIEGVFSLMPGQYLKVSSDVAPIFKTYWSPTRDFYPASNSIKDVQKNVRDKLTESVKKRLVSDVPFGAFLSGGTDSSIIVALMSQESAKKIDTFSVVFDEEEFSERKFAKQIADQYQTNHHEIELKSDEFKALIPEAFSTMDHPSGDGLNTFVVSKKTRESNIKMALSGLGGDELFGGYSIFNQVPALQSKKWLYSFPSYLRKQIGILNHWSKGTIESAKIREILKLPTFDLEYIYQFYRQVSMDDQIETLLDRKNLPESSVLRSTHELIGFKKEGWELQPLSRISVAEMSTYMQNVLLRDADQMSMANGLELRVPFLDHDLVSYVLGVRDEIKKPITPKKLLVDSFSDLIPSEIYNRKKMGFVLPYEKWMKTELKSFCESRINELKKIPYFRKNGIDQYWTKFLAGNKRVTWSRIWPLVALGDWIKENKIVG